jgi:hypothetical protein
MGVDGVNAIAVILIASFAIDRVVTGLLFLLSFIKPWARWLPSPAPEDDPKARAAAEKKHKLVYFALAAALGTVVVSYFGDVRILAYVGFQTNRYLDTILTGLILVAGADRIGPLMEKVPGAPKGVHPDPGSKPIAVSGTITLVGGADQSAR